MASGVSLRMAASSSEVKEKAERLTSAWHMASLRAGLFFAMAFSDSYSFSHRFSCDKATSDTAGYQEIIHQCQEVNAISLTRQFYQFALGCGYAPQSMVTAFEMMAEEYGDAYCKNKAE